MINKKEDIINYLGTTIFIVLFFLFISAFSDKSANQTCDSLRYELKSEFHSNHAKAVIADAIQLPSFQKSWVSVLDKMNFKLFNKTLKISADNNKIADRIILLQKVQLLIKPITFCGFYYHLFSIDLEELPILS